MRCSSERGRASELRFCLASHCLWSVSSVFSGFGPGFRIVCVCMCMICSPWMETQDSIHTDRYIYGWKSARCGVVARDCWPVES